MAAGTFPLPALSTPGTPRRAPSAIWSSHASPPVASGDGDVKGGRLPLPAPTQKSARHITITHYELPKIGVTTSGYARAV